MRSNQVRRLNLKEQFDPDKKKEKADIIKRALSRVNEKQPTESNADAANDNNDLLKEIKRLKKQIDQHRSMEKKASEQVEKLNKTLKINKEELRSERKNAAKLAEVIKSLKNSISVLDESLSRKNNELMQKDETITSLQGQIAVLQNNELLLQIRSLEQEKKELVREGNDIINKLNDELNILTEQNETMKIHHKAALGSIHGTNKVLNKEVKDLKKRNALLQGKLNSIGNLVPSYGLFLNLADQMHIGNYRQFAGYQLISRKFYHLKNLEFERKKRMAALNFEDSSDDEFGYLIKKNEEWLFINIDNHLFNVHVLDKQDLIEDYPARATLLQDNMVMIEEVFNIEESSQLTRYNRRKRKSDSNNEEYSYIGNFKILIIGSENMNKYAARLRKHGFDVDTHDSYEESRRALEGKISSSDVVLYLSSHSRHLSEIKNFDDNPEKLEVIVNDNEDALVVRARYAGIRLGLIKTGVVEE